MLSFDNMQGLRLVTGVAVVLIAALAIQGSANLRKPIEDDTELFLNFLRNDVLPERYRGPEYFKKIVSKSKGLFKLSRFH